MKAQGGDVRGRTGKMYSTGVLCTSDSATLQKQSFFFPRTYCFFSATEVVKMYERCKKNDFQICIDAKNNKLKCMLLFKF